MNPNRPEAETEYSKGVRPFRPGSARLAGALGGLGAALLVAAELTHLLVLRTVSAPPRTVGTEATGHHDAWALIPIAVLALLLAGRAVAARGERRTLSAGLGLLGLAALGIALGVDLPAVHRIGVVGSPRAGLHEVQAHAGVGLYLETLGAIGLVIAGAAGLLLAPRPTDRPRDPRRRRGPWSTGSSAEASPRGRSVT